MSHALAITFLLSSAIVGMRNIPAAFGEDRPFRITTKRDDDRVEAKVDEGKAHVSVRSPFGISQAVIERSGKHWPEIVTLRLHLKGLENLKVTNGKDTVEAAVSSQHGKVRLWMNCKEDSPLDAKSPYWMEIRIVRKDGKPVKTIPLKNGYFEMQLPKALFEGNPRSISVRWIDFYR